MKKVIVGLMLVMSVASVSMALDTPVMTSVTNYGAFMDVRFNDVVGADGYIVHRSTYPGGLGEVWISQGWNFNVGNPDRVPDVSIVSVTTNTITLSWGSGLTTGTSYYFKVQSYVGTTQSAVSNEMVKYIPDRSISGYKIWTGYEGNFSYNSIATLSSDTHSYTLNGLTRNRKYSYKVSAISSIDATGYGVYAPLSPANYISTTTLSYILSDPHSVSLSITHELSAFGIIVNAKVSFVGYDGYGGDGYYSVAHSTTGVFVDSDYERSVYSGAHYGSITDLVDAGLQVSDLSCNDGATNYYSIRIIDYDYSVDMFNPTLTMTNTTSYYQMSYEIDHYEISVATSVTAGTSFPITVTAINSDGVMLNSSIGDTASIIPIMADDESLLGSGDLTVTADTTKNGNATILHRAYKKAEDIKIKMIYNGKTAISSRIMVAPGALNDMDVSVSPASIISGQSAYITSILTDIYNNRIKSIKIQFHVNKGKGKLDKNEDATDVTGKVKIKFFHDDVTPGINMIHVTALNLTTDVQINVAVLVYGKKGGTIVASEDPDTQVVIPPDAVSGDVQLMIKTGDELSDETKTKVNNANDKEKGNMCEDKVRNFECKKDDGSDYGNFDDCVTIEIPYKDDDNDDVVDGTNIKVDDLKVCRLDETDECWTEVADGGCNEIDKNKKVIKAQVKHFSTYNIGAPSIVGSSELHVYPNPVNFSKAVRNTMKFENLNQDSTVKIYDVTGRLIRSMTGGTKVEWDGKNESGESVGMGLYIYLLTDGNGNKKTGKIGVQK